MEEYNRINRNYFPEAIDVIVVGRPERLHRSSWSIASAEDLPPLSISEVQARSAPVVLVTPGFWGRIFTFEFGTAQ